MAIAEEPIVKSAKEDDYTSVTFEPDLERFKMDGLDDDTVALMARRAYDIAASKPGIKVYLNDKRLPVNKFEDYCKLYLSNNEGDGEDASSSMKLVHEKPNERWEIAIGVSDIGFQQVSFVNSIATTKGGRHVDYITEQVVKNLTELIKKKNKNGNAIKAHQIKNHMWVFLNCLIENPTFDSQTKENMTLVASKFGSKCQLSDDFMKKLSKCGLVDRVMNWLAYKEKTDLDKAGSKSKVSKIKGIPKLDDANDAGTKESQQCTLIVTEGDSAKTLAVSGLGVIGRDKYGVFPLRGKMLNVREASARQIIENSEVSNLLKIIGLNFSEKYESRDSLKSLRYGKLMIMTDQDQDGSHIKGLIINFIHFKWPNLLKHGFIEEFITPIIKVTKGNQVKSFYSMPEFEEFQNNTENWASWKVKYYKGLGTSTSKEAKEYFSDMKRHKILFNYTSMRDDLAIQLAFSKKFIEERKDWLTRFMQDRKIREENHTKDDYLYQKDTTRITYKDFVNKELVLFSNLDNERSIPSMMDGFKPGQRKVMFSCFKRNLVKELKVAQLAGSVAELSAYHHGEASLMGTIINLAQ
jgi:DNA topoisomerase II